MQDLDALQSLYDYAKLRAHPQFVPSSADDAQLIFDTTMSSRIEVALLTLWIRL